MDVCPRTGRHEKKPEVTADAEGGCHSNEPGTTKVGELADESITHTHWDSLPSGDAERLATVSRHGNNFQPLNGLPEVKTVIYERNNTRSGNKDIAKEKTDDLEHTATETLQVKQGMLGITRGQHEVVRWCVGGAGGPSKGGRGEK